MSFLPSILSILVMAEFVLGNFANGFIALVNCIDWVRRQKISCADRILTALAVSRIVSRIGLLWTIIFYWYSSMFYPVFYSLEVRAIVYIVWVVSNHFSLWLATSLSILYLLKIANFSCPLFPHLKWKAKRVVIMILWGTLVFLVCRLALLYVDEKLKMNERKGNSTWETNLRDTVRLSNITVFMLIYVIPFTVCLTAFLLLIFSLWKHLKRMLLSNKGSQEVSTKVHVRAMLIVISFLLLLAIYFVTLILSVWGFYNPQNIPVSLCFQIFTIAYPSGHSLILIWGNKKLSQEFLSVTWQVRCWLKGWKPSTP
ncbi:PREDICTED: taste receptor type 2 member 31-like [Miniopterus natalensis]|uniref:taste receptor type 2 member 31-like n=1 Tax=Miniopterus natalensis TaxID=291302 RepID=UPI0007A6C3D3|nr:PREDICTED: taste receptor type 2 member 31-like [Miniopterus natalensis]